MLRREIRCRILTEDSELETSGQKIQSPLDKDELFAEDEIYSVEDDEPGEEVLDNGSVSPVVTEKKKEETDGVDRYRIRNGREVVLIIDYTLVLSNA